MSFTEKTEYTAEAPPPYSNKGIVDQKSSTTLALNIQHVPMQPVTLHMQGEYRSPDFIIIAPDGTPVFSVQTDSTYVYHQMDITDLLASRRLFTIKRKGHADDEQWFYSATEPTKDGKKLLEISTKPTLVEKGGSTRLVFRSAADGDLDALHLDVTAGAADMKVLYQQKQIGSIQMNPKAKDPGFLLNVPAGFDPVLMIVMALVVDDRLMTKRRRVRRPLGSGFTGIGKGPGAGLAGAYALGGAI